MYSVLLALHRETTNDRMPMIAHLPRRYGRSLHWRRTTTKTYWTNMCRECGRTKHRIAHLAQCHLARPYHREDAPPHMTRAWSVMVP